MKDFAVDKQRFRNAAIFLTICLVLVLTHAYIYFDRTLNFLGMTVILLVAAISITINRRNTYKRLREKQRQLSSIIDNLPGFAYRCAYDEHWTMIYVSERCKTITGYEPADFINNKKISFGEIILPQFREDVNKTTDEAIRRKKSFIEEYMIRTAAGEEKWILERGAGVYGNNGELLFLEGYIEDISERKQREFEIIKSEEALRESTHTYSELFNGMDETVWVINLQGEIIDINRSVTEKLGYTLEELKEIGINGLDASLTFEEIKDLIRTIPSDRRQVFETLHKRKDGQTIPVEISSSIVTYKGKKAILGIARDITIRKEMELAQKKHEQEEKELYFKLLAAKEKAEESERLKMAFLANMSHEIRTPMNGIIGFMELLKEPNLEEQSRKEYINLVNISGQRLLSTINDIMEISKIESGELTIHSDIINLEELMRYYYNFFQPETESKSLELKLGFHLYGQESEILSDKPKIDSILTNLIKNAIKFTDKGCIEFGNYIDDEDVVFYVRDTGKGIKDDMHHQIFERFVQADNHFSRSYEGSGLGLAIAKAYAEVLGGKIWVHSEPYKGSTFSFSIPYATPLYCDFEAKTPEMRLDNENKQKTILIAEDDEISFRYLEKILKDDTFKLIHAKTGVEAVTLAREVKDISLILMDIKMPEMDGLEATRLIRSFDQDIMIIAQTAYALKDDEHKAIEAGCNAYISKPVKKELLMQLIKKANNTSSRFDSMDTAS